MPRNCIPDPASDDYSMRAYYAAYGANSRLISSNWKTLFIDAEWVEVVEREQAALVAERDS